MQPHSVDSRCLVLHGGQVRELALPPIHAARERERERERETVCCWWLPMWAVQQTNTNQRQRQQHYKLAGPWRRSIRGKSVTPIGCSSSKKKLSNNCSACVRLESATISRCLTTRDPTWRTGTRTISTHTSRCVYTVFCVRFQSFRRQSAWLPWQRAGARTCLGGLYQNKLRAKF